MVRQARPLPHRRRNAGALFHLCGDRRHHGGAVGIHPLLRSPYRLLPDPSLGNLQPLPRRHFHRHQRHELPRRRHRFSHRHLAFRAKKRDVVLDVDGPGGAQRAGGLRLRPYRQFSQPGVGGSRHRRVLGHLGGPDAAPPFSTLRSVSGGCRRGARALFLPETSKIRGRAYCALCHSLRYGKIRRGVLAGAGYSGGIRLLRMDDDGAVAFTAPRCGGVGRLRPFEAARSSRYLEGAGAAFASFSVFFRVLAIAKSITFFRYSSGA